jgi:hypothetical protein
MFGLASPFFVFSCWKWGDWKNWKLYYPTILYMILVNFLTHYITAHYPLWEYNYKFLNSTLIDIFVSFTVFPSTVILYLSHYPKKKSKQLMYILLWASLFFLLEAICSYLGFFVHKNGWSLWWSAGFDIGIFIMIRLHYKHPLLAWPISAAMMAISFYILKLPIGTMR